MFFTSAAMLVQKLLIAKRDLRLSQELKKLDKFDAILIDDIGYIQQDREEMEVLFTLLAERYERRSVMITTNLVFSQMGADLQGSDDHGGGRRPSCASFRDPRAEPEAQLPGGEGPGERQGEGRCREGRERMI